MRFVRWPLGERVTDADTLARLTQTPQIPARGEALEPMTLFPDTIHQTPKRAALWTREQAYSRTRRAKAWRKVRRMVEALPDEERADFLTVWRAPGARRLYPGTPRGVAEFLALVLEDDKIKEQF
ncbi:hypothetical protein [Acetobacter conturbans]|uniref:Uncharacterized protein n=1 Tax=Acetobacter conturbans TaxID=1737472 RepID=A0ABX0K281_9PROT|nr:hypothetical protein [Acetobacter conturbans]NHN89837.1 hypothetical protein [Acetobacter conturbans]